MTILLPALAVAFAAFCMWLTVRIVNRRERWAKWTLAAAIGVPVLYVANFGPACWLCENRVLPQRATWMIFRPITWFVVDGNEPARTWLTGYAEACGDKRRIEFRFEEMPPPTGLGHYSAALCGEKCSIDSVSPIDYEFDRQSLVDAEKLRRHSRLSGD